MTHPMKRLKHLVTLRRSHDAGRDREQQYVGLENIEPWTGKLMGETARREGIISSAANEPLSNGFERGDVLFGKLRPYLAKAWVAEFSGSCTTEALVMEPHSIEPRFLRNVCLSSAFIAAVDASTFGSRMPRADWSFIGNMPIPLPEWVMQVAIADYLDRETEQLDTLVVAKKRLLDLIAEKRRSVISYAISRGVDPRAPLRDSGSLWFGEVQESWPMKPLGVVADCLTSNVDKHHVEGEQPIRLANYTDVYKNEYIHPGMELMRATASEAEKARFALLAGDVVITKDSESWEDIGVPALVTETAEDIVCGYHLALLRPNPDVMLGRFLFRLLQARPVQVQLEFAAKGMTRFGLSKSDIKKTLLPVPPLSTQATIADHLDGRTAQLDDLSSAALNTIELLKERRIAMISAAVAGDVAVGNGAKASK